MEQYQYSKYKTALVLDHIRSAPKVRAYWTGVVGEKLGESKGNELEAAHRLAKELRETYEASIPNNASGIWADLLFATLNNIAWVEIGAALIKDYRGKDGNR